MDGVGRLVKTSSAEAKNLAIVPIQDLSYGLVKVPSSNCAKPHTITLFASCTALA